MPWLYKRPDSKVWWIGWRAGGRQYLKSTKTRDRQAAERELAKVEVMFKIHQSGSVLDSVYESLSGEALPNVTLRAAVANWLSECKNTVSARQLKKCTNVTTGLIESAFPAGTDPLLRNVTADHVRKFLEEKLAKTTPGTANTALVTLSTFFTRAMRRGEIRAVPTKSIQRFKSSRKGKVRRRPFTIAELKTIYRVAPSDFWRFMILAAALTGLRLGDLILVEVSAFDFRENLIRVVASKTDQTLLIPLHPSLRLFVLDLVKNRAKTKSDLLWPDEAARYRKAGAAQFSTEFRIQVLVPAGLADAPSRDSKSEFGRAGKRQVNPLGFHSLRHSFVSLLKASGSGQSVAHAMAGHSSDAMSDNYTSLPPETLAAAVKALPEIAG